MTLRPGHAPARMLLDLWAVQGRGESRGLSLNHHARARLIELGYVAPNEWRGSWRLTLTQAGRLAAQALEMGGHK